MIQSSVSMSLYCVCIFIYTLPRLQIHKYIDHAYMLNTYTYIQIYIHTYPKRNLYD